MMVSTVYFEENVNISLTQYLIPKEPALYYIWTASNCILFIMGGFSYLQVIRISNKMMSYLPFPKEKTQLKNNHPLYSFQNKCEKEQDRFKPPRTSHCKRDGCAVRFVLLA